MKNIPASIFFIILFMIILHIFTPVLVPINAIYHYRLPYNFMINNHNDLNVALDKIRIDINEKKLKDYMIILGDSVFYGSPGRSEDTFNAVIEKKLVGGKTQQIYNLSLPATQTGDIYAMLLKLDHYGISTDHLIFNVRYASFVSRYNYESALFWWLDDLHSMELEAYQRSLPVDAYDIPFTKPYVKFKNELENVVLPYFNVYAYKDYLNEALNYAWVRKTGGVIASDELGPSKPWYEKDVKEYMEQPEIKKAFSNEPIDLTEKNVDIYFINKIIEHQKMKDTLLVLTGTNHSLMKDFIEKPGYQENSKKINDYFAAQPIKFLNLEGSIPDNLFTDHTHLMPDGYRELGRLVWDAFKSEERYKS